MDRYEIKFKSDNVLELGGGARPLPFPHTNMDIRKADKVDVVHDFEVFPYPIEANKFDGLYSAYVIEHITWHNIEKFIGECFRVLNQGGKAVLLTANLLEQCKKVINEGVNPITIETLFGAQEFPDHAGCHKTGFSPEYAKKLFEDAGFTNVQVFAPMPDVIYGNYVIYPHCVTDMVIQAEKPEPNLEVHIT